MAPMYTCNLRKKGGRQGEGERVKWILMQIKRVNGTGRRFQVKQEEAKLATEELCLPSCSVMGNRKQRDSKGRPARGGEK